MPASWLSPRDTPSWTCLQGSPCFIHFNMDSPCFPPPLPLPSPRRQTFPRVYVLLVFLSVLAKCGVCCVSVLLAHMPAAGYVPDIWLQRLSPPHWVLRDPPGALCSSGPLFWQLPGATWSLPFPLGERSGPWEWKCLRSSVRSLLSVTAVTDGAAGCPQSLCSHQQLRSTWQYSAF